ncbi:MAG: ArnT family glycosyltransferase [bacterium]
MRDIKSVKVNIIIFTLFFLFLLSSYLLISSNYNYVNGDAGAFAKHARVLYETNTFDITGSAASSLGMLIFSNILSHIFGFSLKTLHWSVYCVGLLNFIAMYLLLKELDVKSFLAFWGSLTLLINPISLILIDWYLTESFFLFYIIISLYFFLKGFKSDRILFLYCGGFFAVLAILTRQHAISLSIALFILCLIYRKKLTKKFLIHSIFSLSLPIIAIILFYLHAFMQYRASNSTIQYAYASSNVQMIKELINPLILLSRIFFGSITFFHYSVLYLAPLFIMIFISILKRPNKIKELFSNYIILDISLLLIGLGTLILFFKDKKLMPYRPNIFTINALTSIFSLKIVDKNTAAIILTILTSIGALLIIIRILDHFYYHSYCFSFLRSKTSYAINRNNNNSPISEDKKNIAKDLLYLWGIIYILVAIFIGLRYDRYIFPLSIMSIFLILDYFPWLMDNKKTFILVYFLIYSIFMFRIINIRLGNDLSAHAADYLINKGIQRSNINGGLGFNHYHNYDYIINLYKDVKVKYPINWVKFHPMAHYFIRSNKDLDKKHPGLILLKSFTRKRFFGLIDKTIYIYKRKDNYKKFIML